MITSAAFTDLYAPGLRNIFFESYTYRPTEYDKLLNVNSTTEQFIKDYGRMAGFGSVPTKPEGTATLYDDPVAGTTKTYTWTPRGKGFRITHEAQVDERYGQMRKMSSSLGRAFRNATEIDGASILNNAFNVAFAGFEAGVALCSTLHTLARTGATRSNTAAVDLSVSALQDALISFEQQVDESGVPILIRPRWLVVDSSLAPMAREILGSQFKPYTSDNEINVLQEYGLGLFVSHYLTDSDSWFILADKSDHDLNFFWREKVVTMAGDDFDTGDGKMKGYMRSGISFGDWLGVWGSSGI